jgi:N-methylhydantoinase A
VSPERLAIAIDTGGTFTDCVYVSNGRLGLLKVPSTPHEPSVSVLQAIWEVLRRESVQGAWEIRIGTTVGTNALLERRGARVALLTTAGFEDVLEIGRQDRPRLYDWMVTRPQPLVERRLRLGVRERVDARGRVLVGLQAREVERLVRLLKARKPEAVAVCLVFSFLLPRHEQRLGQSLRREGFPVCLSHEIVPEFREYERTATTVANAYLLPLWKKYLGRILQQASQWGDVRVQVMQSNGGIVDASMAADEPVRSVLSGPAGGVLGARAVARLAGLRRLITLDMGGTSTDVAVVEDEPEMTTEARVADIPLAVPMLQIHSVGAGGGSIARLDAGGALRVGPESAGADPGPLCYGRGERPAVTDAHLVLGHLPPDGLLGGSFPLDADRTWKGLERARGPLKSVEDFAVGILRVADATMEKAIRVMTVERGRDPRDYTLVAFGGAGGLHACWLAASLRIPRVLIPVYPGALSALGILSADVVRDLSWTVRRPVKTLSQARAELEPVFRRLEREGLRQMRIQGWPADAVSLQRLVDMRYVGQGYELTVDASGDFVAAFHRAHRQRYSYADPAWPTEVVNVRVRCMGQAPRLQLPRRSAQRGTLEDARLDRRRVIFPGYGREPRWTPFYDRERLQAGWRIPGPAVIVEYSATTLLPPNWQAHVDRYGNLLLERVQA